MINGITAAPVMCIMILMASDRKMMGKLTLPVYPKVLGWPATLINAFSAAGMLLPQRKQQMINDTARSVLRL
jgi:Mn2+/Fe2+ NRAMP family transporter